MVRNLERILFTLFVFVSFPAFAQECRLIFFYSTTCPHCTSEKAFLAEMEKQYPGLVIESHDYALENDLFKQKMEEWGSIPIGVPRTYVQNKLFIGFTEGEGELKFLKSYQAYHGISNQIEKAIAECLGVDPVDGAAIEAGSYVERWGAPALLIAAALLFFFLFRNRIDKRYLLFGVFTAVILSFYWIARSVPEISVLDFAERHAFPIFTVVLALFDGFNPCAFAVLAILLSLLTYSKSRTMMTLIGLIFILTSGVMYFLFIMMILTLRTEMLSGYQHVMRLAVGAVALVAGLINLKDFFWFKKGVSLTISEQRMGHLTRKMKEVTDGIKDADTGWKILLAVLGTISLAIIVNFIELGCTLILPVQYIEVLITNYGENLTVYHMLYTALYCAVYIIPLLVILGSFLYTFKSDRMTEREGRVLKLVSGSIMVALGLILIFVPELLAFV